MCSLFKNSFWLYIVLYRNQWNPLQCKCISVDWSLMSYRDLSWINFRLCYNFVCFVLGIVVHYAWWLQKHETSSWVTTVLFISYLKSIYIYIYIYINIHLYTYIYNINIYIYYIYMYMYIYMYYTYICVCIYVYIERYRSISEHNLKLTITCQELYVQTQWKKESQEKTLEKT